LRVLESHFYSDRKGLCFRWTSAGWGMWPNWFNR